MLYAVGQGALAVECKQSNDEIISLLKPLYHLETALCVVAERMFLRTLGGGCSAPVGVWTDFEREGNTVTIKMKGAVWSLDGKDELLVEDECAFKLKAVESKEFEKESVRRNGSCKRNCEGSLKIGTDGSSKKQKLETDITPSGGDSSEIDACSNCEEISHKNHELKSTVAVFNRLSSKEDSDASNEITNPSKKQKLEHGVTVPDTESPRTDSGGRCPLIHYIDVGEDFMGKCPVPESHLNYLDDKTKLENFTKCPFSKCCSHDVINSLMCSHANETTSTNCDNVKQFEDDEMFGAVVPIDGVSIKTYKEVGKLGCRLAENLKSKGAVDMIIKSQNFIRNN